MAMEQASDRAKRVWLSQHRRFQLMQLKRQLDKAETERCLTATERAFMDCYELLQVNKVLP